MVGTACRIRHGGAPKPPKTKSLKNDKNQPPCSNGTRRLVSALHEKYVEKIQKRTPAVHLICYNATIRYGKFLINLILRQSEYMLRETSVFGRKRIYLQIKSQGSYSSGSFQLKNCRYGAQVFSRKASMSRSRQS